jgi:hypothetical protein
MKSNGVKLARPDCARHPHRDLANRHAEMVNPQVLPSPIASGVKNG